MEAAELSPSAQVQLFSQARVLIGQHGAGLANMVWMPPGSQVVEIKPPLDSAVDTIFEHLAAEVGHKYVAVNQDDQHSSVASQSVADALQSSTET